MAAAVDTDDAGTYRRLREQAIEGVSAGSPVVAIQPDSHIDIRRNFYLVPILGHEDVLVGGQQARLLRVATVPLRMPCSCPPPMMSGATSRSGLART